MVYVYRRDLLMTPAMQAELERIRKLVIAENEAKRYRDQPTEEERIITPSHYERTGEWCIHYRALWTEYYNMVALIEALVKENERLERELGKP